MIGSLVLSLLISAATARIPSLLGMLVYREETSSITKSASGRTWPIFFSQFIKCCVSLTYGAVLVT